MVQLPNLFVYAVVPGEDEIAADDMNKEGSLEVYRCPVFMNRVGRGY